MIRRYAGGAFRSVGVLYGIVSLCCGVAIFVAFVGLPSRLPYLLPPSLGRLLLDVAPWLVTTPGSSTNVLGSFLASLAFVGFGLWSLHSTLLGSDD